MPACSVVIPSFNRRATLEMVIDGLSRQTLGRDLFEIVVVLDGGTDDSPRMLEHWRDNKGMANLRWHTQPNAGQASARNTGVGLARSDVIVFLDDDVAPEPGLLAAHLRWHSAGESVAVLGDCLIVREQRESLYHLGVWAWWEDKYHRRARPGRQSGYRDFCTGNVSLRKADFLRVGGFDTAFRGYGGEDFEMGWRLLRAGVQFVADRSAVAHHYHRTTAMGVLRATRQEGHGDILIGTKHPELRAGLRLMWRPTGRMGRMAKLATRHPRLGDWLFRWKLLRLGFYERLKMRRRWTALFDDVRCYSYFRGVRDALGSAAALDAFRDGALPNPRVTIDVADGLPADLPALFVDGPMDVQVLWRGEELGVMYLPAFDEPVREHLTAKIIDWYWNRIILRLAMENRRPSEIAR